jgi:hypothetical protein
MYRQYDGYLEGHGLELAEFLAPFYVTNGISGGEKRTIANGMGCLAAQLIANFKDGPGGIYLEVPGSGDHWEEYVYTVYLDKPGQRPQELPMNDEGVLKIRVVDTYHNNTIFDGTPSELLDHIAHPSTDVCVKCGSEFKHFMHARNHYAKHHGIAV